MKQAFYFKNDKSDKFRMIDHAGNRAKMRERLNFAIQRIPSIHVPDNGNVDR
ncbi:hypothetical protein FACS189475_00380 [Betaproteobacteria bacterium]|nr:hypothetical protein FACS189475_00380 [Betaproteobacteria bacterium]